jgi:hypothetical protein
MNRMSGARKLSAPTKLTVTVSVLTGIAGVAQSSQSPRYAVVDLAAPQGSNRLGSAAMTLRQAAEFHTAINATTTDHA